MPVMDDGKNITMLVTPHEARILEAVRGVPYGEVRVFTRNNLPQRIERVESELLEANGGSKDAANGKAGQIKTGT